MKRTDPQSIREIIDRVMDRAVCDEGFMEQRAAAMWGVTLGEAVAAHTSRRFVRQNVLHVYLDSAPLKSELSFQREQITAAINKALGTDFLLEIRLH